jgi:hypothetical protein
MPKSGIEARRLAALREGSAPYVAKKLSRRPPTCSVNKDMSLQRSSM